MSARETADHEGRPPAWSEDWRVLLAGSLAVLVAGVHLYWGIPRFTAYAAVGIMPDPRPLAFVLSGHAILVVLTLVGVEVVAVRRTYLPGMGLMVVHLGSYAAWHTVLAHGVEGAGSGGDGHAHLHVGNAAWVVVQHVVNSPLALVSKIAELALLILLGWLYLRSRDGPTGP